MNPDRNPGRLSEAEPRYLPLAINMAGRKCLVVGGGRVGTRKVTTLVDAGTAVLLAAPQISETLQRLVALGRVEWHEGEYDPTMLAGMMLVVAATDDRALNLHIAAEAEARGILACNASAGNRSRVIFPAVYADEEVTVAVHTSGRNCRLSQQVRNDIAAWLPRRNDMERG